jgi:FHS family Na+ dependent glucose MFS transporter 1
MSGIIPLSPALDFDNPQAEEHPLPVSHTSSESTLRILQTTGYYVTVTAFGLIVAVWGPTLPTLAVHTGTDLGQIGILFTTNSLGFFLGSTLGGRLVDSLHGHRVMVGALTAITLGFVLIPLITILWVLAVVMFLTGVVSGTVMVGSTALLARVHSENLGPWMTGLHFFSGVGAFLCPILVTRVLDATGDVNWTFWAIAVAILFSGFWLALVASPPPTGRAAPGEAGHTPWAAILPIALLFVFYVGAEQSYAGWLFSYATRAHGASDLQGGLLTSAFWGALTVGRLIAIPVSARVRDSTILFAGLAGALLSLGLLLFSDSLRGIWIGTLAFGLSMAPIFPTLMAYAGRRMRLDGRVSGAFFSAAALGGMTLPWLSGQLFMRVGPRLVMVVILAALLLALSAFAGINLAGRRSEAERAAL